MFLHKEKAFEEEICDSLAANGWLYQQGDAALYDRANSFFMPDLAAWLEETQPEAWRTLCKANGNKVEAALAERLRKNCNERGTLEVLRRGLEMIGLRHPLSLAQFKPAFGLNENIARRYAANRLRVIRQVHHSVNNEHESMDLVLFLNGIPVATAELKSEFTQSVHDAVDQYRFDRDPAPKAKAVEPLLSFPRGALVHFAVSQNEVYMATRLSGPGTTFLPFNKGNNGASGNPENPNGYSTAYLWEEIWQRDSWLEIIGRYIIAKRDSKKKLTTYIFPRYHQLDATRKIIAAIAEEGPGGKYLIQHSAGSGKTNSIAWTAHFLADLHNAADKKIFDSVLVISDRQVLDKQLQEAVFDFERTAGVVESITDEHGSKSAQLTQALKAGKKIIICTVQTFPFALQAVRELAATEGKTFAVIADEAHSSQSGNTSVTLKKVLSAEELADIADGGQVSTEDLLNAQMEARVRTEGISFIAFTATPKNKTLELFGRVVDIDRPPLPFHVYSMRQAIEEGFILDVLKNYTSYRLAFKLAHEGREWDQDEVDRSEARKGLMQWVRLHPYNIASKVQVVVEHFRENVQPLLNGDAKAMIVVGSRKEAVRWQKALREYIKRQGYALDALVAFSGEVIDAETCENAVTENSKELNPGLKGRDIREAFATSEYQILLVANKYQTGFDQPLLCGMYIDRRLADIQAVQTLSRLNRAYPGKDTTYILDFADNQFEVLTAFKKYYETAELEDTTNPNLVYDLRAKLDGTGYYSDVEVEKVAQAVIKPNARQSELAAAIIPVSQRLLAAYKSARERKIAAEARGDAQSAKTAKDEMDSLILFKGDLGAFIRVYTFLSQIFNYGNTDIEKRHIFYRHLLPLLEFGRERDDIDLSKVKLTHHTLKNLGTTSFSLNKGEAPKIKPISDTGSGSVQDKDKVFLAEIIEKMNELFEGELTDGDQLVYVNGVIKGKLLENEELAQQARDNSKEQFANSPDLSKAILDAIMDAMDAHKIMSTQALNSSRVQEGLKALLLGPVGLYEALRKVEKVE